jgi:hypothetical protein
MATRHGNLELLNDPVAQNLLKSTRMAQLAYVWSDGTPRVVPIWFHWNGRELVMGTPPEAPKLKALHTGSQVAITIEDSSTWPYKVLYLRGPVQVEWVEGIVPEYALSALHYFGEEAGNNWLAQVKQLTTQMARLSITPQWVSLCDFETRFPSAIESAIAAAAAGA